MHHILLPTPLEERGRSDASVTAGATSPETLCGVPASSGIATGKARVVRDLSELHLEPGEILVAVALHAHMTPYLPLAAALVAQTGGALSDGAIVAREYRLPAVVGVRDATERIATGQTITVDGTAGTVTVGH